VPVFACRQGKISKCFEHSGPTIRPANLILAMSVKRIPQHSQWTSCGSIPFSRNKARFPAAITSRLDGTRISRPENLSWNIRLIPFHRNYYYDEVFNKPVVDIVTRIVEPMFTRILTESERKAIAKYLRKDGEKEAAVREIVYRSKKHLPQIEKDLALVKELLGSYERNKTK